MTALTYAIVTPSYWKDLERCRLLVESVDRFVPTDVPHYLVIARLDLPLFQPMIRGRTRLLVVEEIIPRWLFRVPGFKHFWFSLKTRPVKNWILQQIVKLSVPLVIGEDVLLYADSDMFFTGPYDPRAFERDGQVPLFLERGQRGLIKDNDEWQAVGSRLLGIAVEPAVDTNYVNQLVCWRRANAVGAVERVAETMQTEWQRAIAPLSGFSEYILYGLYSYRVLGERSGHWHDERTYTLNYWRTKPLDREALRAFRASAEPHHHSAMISAKSYTAIDDIRAVFLEG